jgi:hypothetical protein
MHASQHVTAHDLHSHGFHWRLHTPLIFGCTALANIDALMWNHDMKTNNMQITERENK